MLNKDIQHALEIYEELIIKHPEIKRKGKRLPYTSIKGNMFSFISKEGHIGLRFSEESVHNYMDTYGFVKFVQNDKVMEDYVQIPDDFLENELLDELFTECCEYAATLQAKPQSKKKESRK
jgi:hypothetical protein